MSCISRILLFALLGVLCSCVVSAGEPKPAIYGEITGSKHNDTLLLKYSLEACNFTPDSIVLEWTRRNRDMAEHTVLRRDTGLARDSARPVSTRINGIIREGLDGAHIPEKCYLQVWGHNGPDSVWFLEYVHVRRHALTMLFNFWGYGFTWGTVPTYDERHAGLWSGEIGFTLHRGGHDFSLLSSTSSNLYDGHLIQFSEAPIVRYSCFPFGRAHWAPSLFGGFKRTTMTLDNVPEVKQGEKWGSEIGVSLQGNFERFSYSYSSARGGYHTASVLIARVSGGFLRAGTRYEMIFTEHITTARIILHIEGGGWGDGETESVLRKPTRPWWHKGLSYGAELPLLPIIGVVKLVRKIRSKKDDHSLTRPGSGDPVVLTQAKPVLSD